MLFIWEWDRCNMQWCYLKHGSQDQDLRFMTKPSIKTSVFKKQTQRCDYVGDRVYKRLLSRWHSKFCPVLSISALAPGHRCEEASPLLKSVPANVAALIHTAHTYTVPSNLSGSYTLTQKWLCKRKFCTAYMLEPARLVESGSEWTHKTRPRWRCHFFFFFSYACHLP